MIDLDVTTRTAPREWDRMSWRARQQWVRRQRAAARQAASEREQREQEEQAARDAARVKPVNPRAQRTAAETTALVAELYEVQGRSVEFVCRELDRQPRAIAKACIQGGRKDLARPFNCFGRAQERAAAKGVTA